MSQRKANFVSEEAKNLYNAMMINNYKIQQEINAYAMYSRVKQQLKLANNDHKPPKGNLPLKPRVLYDRDSQGSNLKSCLKANSNFGKSKKHGSATSSKGYALKFNVLQARCGEVYENWDSNLQDLQAFSLVNLTQKVDSNRFEQAMLNLNDINYSFVSKSSEQMAVASSMAKANTFDSIF